MFDLFKIGILKFKETKPIEVVSCSHPFLSLKSTGSFQFVRRTRNAFSIRYDFSVRSPQHDLIEL